MNKLFNRYIALPLAFAMVIGNTPLLSKADVENDFVKGIEVNSETEIHGDYIDGEVLIMYNSADVSSKSVTKKLGKAIKSNKKYTFKSNKVGAKSAYKGDLTVELIKSENASTKDMMAALNAMEGIKAEPNYRVKKMATNDELYSSQWYLENTESPYNDINIEAISGYKQKTENVVAVIDSGADLEHEDLVDALWTNTNESKQFKGKHGYDFANEDDNPMDDDGHGTHVSGIIAATSNNYVGIKGIATNTKLMELKVLDEDGYGDEDSVIDALNYVYRAKTLYNVNLVAVNMSLGGSFKSEILEEIIDKLGESGVLSVCASGNENVNVDKMPYQSYPAAFDSDYVISVGATNKKGEKASFSNYGKHSVDIFAPGVDIVSTYIEDNFFYNLLHNPQDNSSHYIDRNSGNVVDTIDGGKYIFGNYASSAVQYGMINDGDGESGFFKNEEGSYTWSLSDVQTGESYYLILPYDYAGDGRNVVEAVNFSYNTDSDSAFMMVADVAVKSNGTIGTGGKRPYADSDVIDALYFESGENEYSVSNVKNNKESTKRALIFEVNTMFSNGGDFEVNIDDFVVTKPGAADNCIKKYKGESGTSMATPVVTGAIAAAASIGYGDGNALDLKNYILGSVRPSEKLEGLCSTGGVLDLSYLSSPRMVISNIYYRDGAIRIEGEFLNGIRAFINNERASVTKNTHDEIVIYVDDELNCANQYVDVSLLREDDGVIKRVFVDGNTAVYGRSSSQKLEGAKAVSTGNEILIVCPSGDIYKVDDKMNDISFDTYMKDDSELEYTRYLSDTINPIVFGVEYTGRKVTVTFDSELVYNNGYIYVIATANTTRYSKKKMLKLSIANKGSTWTEAGTLPDSILNGTGTQLFAYNGDVYMLGGMDKNNQFIKEAYEYDDVNGAIEKTGMFDINMPSRANGKIIQTGSKLVMTLGTDGSGEMPANQIFNGERWRESQNNIWKGMTETPIATGLVKEGIVYAGSRIEGLGNIYIYDEDTDEFTATDYYMFDNDVIQYNKTGLPSLTGWMIGEAINNKFFIIDIWDLEGYLDSLEEEFDFEDDLDLDISNSFSYVAYVRSNEVKVSIEMSNGVKAEGAGSYVISDKVDIKLKTDIGYEIKNVECADEKIAESLKKYGMYSGIIADSPSGIAIKVTAEKKSSNKETTQTVTTYNKNENAILKKSLKTKITKAKKTKSKKKAKITAKKVAKARAYQFRYSTSKKYTKKKTKYRLSQSNKIILLGLKKSKKYYVSVRAIGKNSRGDIVYGDWSASKKIKK